MLTLAATNTIQGVAGSATSVTYTILGDEVSSTNTDTFKVLAQGQLAASAGVLYTVPAATSALIKKIILANTTAGSISTTLYINGTAAANQIVTIPIPANGEATVTEDGYKTYDVNGALLTTVSLTSPAHTYKGNNTGSQIPTADITSTQLTADLNPATTSLQGMMIAADKALINNYKLAEVNLADYGADSTGVTSSNTAITNAMAALPAGGGIINVPAGTYLLTSTVTITGYITFRGSTRSNTVFTTNMPTNDMFLVNQWFVGFEFVTFQGQQTTIAVASNGAASSAGTLNVASTTGFAASGTISVTLSNGTWITLTYTGLNAGTQFTGVTGGNATTVATNALVINRTGGYAVNAGTSYNYTQIVNCRFQYQYNCVLNGATLMQMQNVEMRNFVNVGIAISGSSDRYLFQVVADNAIQAAAAIQITQVGALLMANCDLIHSGNTLDVAPTTGVTVPSIKATNCFFDNGITGVRMVTAGSWFRSTFVNCWMSSMSTAGVLLGPTTAGTNVDGISFVGCDIYTNVGGTTNGISVTTANVGKWTATGCRMAGWTSAINVIAGAAHYPQIVDNQIGSVSAFGVNTTGLTVGAGTYLGLVVSNNDLTNNTAAFSLGAVTVTTASLYRITDNAGYNPLTGAAVTTPAVPASTVVATNTTGRRVMVILKSGATAPTVMTVNGVSTVLPLASQVVTLLLEPGGTFAATYTVAFTWTWVGS